MPRMALVSPVAEGSVESRLLRQHGFTVKVAGSQSADIVLPASGGSHAFLVLEGTGFTA